MGKPNAYVLFVSDEARRRNCNKQHLFKELGPKWASMSDEEKQKYKDRAKSLKSSSVDVWPESKKTPVEVPAQSGPMASIAGPIEVKLELESKEALRELISKKRPHDNSSEAAEQEKKKLKPGIPNWKHLKNKNIENPIQYLDKHLYDLREQCQAILRARSHKLITIPIYSFSANVLCKHKKDGEDIFVPLEVCVCAYSIKTGYIGQPYHALIDAGAVPTNCVNAALDHAPNHKISFPVRQGESYPTEARKDYKKIYKEMLDYTKAGERTILIKDSRDLAQVRGCLEWIYKKGMEVPGTKLPKVSTWTILPVTEFAASMHNCVYQGMLKNDHPYLGLYYYINMLLEASTLDYNTAIMCEYHERDENQTKWCAKACAKKMIMSLESPLLGEISRLYQHYQRKQQSLEASGNHIFLNPAAPVPAINYQQNQNYQQQQRQLPAPQVMNMQPPAVMVSQEQPVLAIQAGTTQEMDTSTNRDPRVSGRLRPAEAPIATITLPEFEEPTFEGNPPPRKPKPREEPLIIASSGGVIYEHPPDIY